MIQWCNSNQGFLMVVLTTVYVLATLIIMIYTKKSIDSNKMTLQEMKDARYASERPYVMGYFIYDEHLGTLFLVIKNFGNSLAKIESFSMKPEIKMFDKSPNTFLDGSIIAPNQSLHFLIYPEEKKKVYHGEYNQFVFKFKYMDLATKNIFEEEIIANTEYIGQMLSTRTSLSNLTEKENILRNMEKALNSIAINNLD